MIINNNDFHFNTKNELTINEYFSFLCDKISKNLQPSKKLEKIDNEVVYIPKFNESEYLLKYNDD
jgi:hypothetical protein